VNKVNRLSNRQKRSVYRLSIYLRCLARLRENGIGTVSSEALAKTAPASLAVCQDHSDRLRRITTVRFQIPAANALPGFLFSGIPELGTVL
jgi:hypothetical protein